MALEPSLIFSTGGLPIEQQFDAWRGFFAPVVDIERLNDQADGFAAKLLVWNLGGFVLARAFTPSPGHARRICHLRNAPLDHWRLVLSNGGKSGAPRGSKKLWMYSLARPLERVIDDKEVLSLFIPRDLFGSAAELVDLAQGDLEITGRGGLLADYLVSLQKRLAGLAVEEVPALASATRTLIAACLVPTPDRAYEARAIVNATLLERCRKAIDENLHRPQFRPKHLCRIAAVSRSRLYRIFEPVGGVAHCIQRRRLLRAHDILSDAHSVFTVGRIARECGFVELSVFSRAFRKEFGHSPSETRARAFFDSRAVPGPANNFQACANDNPLTRVLRSPIG